MIMTKNTTKDLLIEEYKKTIKELLEKISKLEKEIEKWKKGSNIMEYHTYQELVNKLNYLLKENRELTYMFYHIPLRTLKDILISPYISNDLKRRWMKIYEKKYRYLQRTTNNDRREEPETSNSE